MIQSFVIWLRQIWCDHDFKLERVEVVTRNKLDTDEVLHREFRIIRTCEFCGHHSDYKEV